MAKMTEEVREKFLAATRLGILTTLTSDGAPISVPVWFDWDGHTLRIFTGVESPKVKRIQDDARVTVLVVNHIDEGEAWVAFDGKAKIRTDGGFELAEMLAVKYWGLLDPDQKDTLNSWKQAAESLRVIELVPTRIRTMI